jgi:hypothetical protein
MLALDLVGDAREVLQIAVPDDALDRIGLAAVDVAAQHPLRAPRPR